MLLLNSPPPPSLAVLSLPSPAPLAHTPLHTPPQAAVAAGLISETGAERATMRPRAASGPHTPLLIPMDPRRQTGHPSPPQSASLAAHGAADHSQQVDQAASVVSAAAQVDGALVAVSAHSVVEDQVAGDLPAHGHQEDLGQMDHGQAGGTEAAAPSLTGLAGPAEAGAHLLHGHHGLVALPVLLLHLSTQLPAAALLTPLLATDTSSLRSLDLGPVPVLHQRRLTARTALPLQVVQLLLASWALLLRSKSLERFASTLEGLRRKLTF